jgi:hypothetical protein
MLTPVIIVTALATLSLTFTIVSSVAAYMTFKYMQAAKKTADDMRMAFNASADAQEALVAQVLDIQTRLNLLRK